MIAIILSARQERMIRLLSYGRRGEKVNYIRNKKGVHDHFGLDRRGDFS
jgi:hypothetical protein